MKNKPKYEDVEFKDVSNANTYRVPKSAWRSWSKISRHVFNEVYSAMTDSPWAFQPPSMPKVNPRAWKVTAWNAAWIAAGAIRRA